MYELPPLPVKKKPRPAYHKPDKVKDLERLADAAVQKKYASVEAKYLSPRKYRDDTANALTKCIIDFLRLSGCQAERINCTGRYIDRTKVFTDVIGHNRQIGTRGWIPSSGQRGASDISSVIRGQSVKIEVKIKDKQSEDQKRYQADIERAGGLYYLATNFTDFKTWFDSL